MLHRRERRAVDNDGGNAGGGQAAGERAAHRAGADDTDLGRKVIAHAAESGAVATVAASVRNGASAIRGFRHIVAAAHEPLEPHGHRPSRRGTQSCLADHQGVDQPAFGGADRAGARAAGIGTAGGAGLLRSARSITEHGDLAAYQQPGGTGGRGAGGPVAARLRRGGGAAGGGDADVGVANRIAPRAGQHGGRGWRPCSRRCLCWPRCWPVFRGRRRLRGRRWRVLGGRSARCSGRLGSTAGREALGSVGAVLVWTFGAAFALTLTLLALGLSAGEWRSAGRLVGRGARYGVSGGRGAAGGVAWLARLRLPRFLRRGRPEAGVAARREATD